jgi:hypothetical protein
MYVALADENMVFLNFAYNDWNRTPKEDAYEISLFSLPRNETHISLFGNHHSTVEDINLI